MRSTAFVAQRVIDMTAVASTFARHSKRPHFAGDLEPRFADSNHNPSSVKNSRMRDFIVQI